VIENLIASTGDHGNENESLDDGGPLTGLAVFCACSQNHWNRWNRFADVYFEEIGFVA